MIYYVERRPSDQGWLFPFPLQPVDPPPPPKMEIGRLKTLNSGSLLMSEEAKATVSRRQELPAGASFSGPALPTMIVWVA